MKKWNLLICVILLMQMFSACSGKSDDFEVPVNLYYCREEISYNSPSAVIQPETREGKDFFGNLNGLLRVYLLGPESDELVSPIPKNVYLVSCFIEEDVAVVVLSGQFAKLSGIKLTTACSAILMTLHDYADVQALRISAKDNTLDDQAYIYMNLDEIVLMDTADIPQ